VGSKPARVTPGGVNQFETDDEYRGSRLPLLPSLQPCAVTARMPGSLLDLRRKGQELPRDLLPCHPYKSPPVSSCLSAQLLIELLNNSTKWYAAE